MALGDVAAVFEARLGTEWVPSADIVAALLRLEDRPWKEWRRGHPLSSNGLARLLKPFGIAPIKTRERGAEGQPFRFVATNVGQL